LAYSLSRLDGKRCLITGGLGFIGSNIAHKLVELGAEVSIVDACLDPYGWNPANIAEIRDKVNFKKEDIRHESAMAKAVKDQDFIFNCAGQVSHVDSMKEPFLDLDINCRGNLVLLEACRKFNSNVKIVYAGTRGQMGSLHYSPADEEHPDNPTDVYGADKLAAEKYHLIYSSAFGMHATSLRINNTYGERHQMKHAKYGIMNWFIRLALEEKEIPVYGDGEQTRDYNYIADVVDACILAAQSPKTDGKYYLLGSGSEIKFIDMVKAVLAEAGTGSYKLVPWPADRKAIEVGNFFVSYKKIQDELGWEPKTSLAEGLRNTVAFYKERMKDYW